MKLKAPIPSRSGFFEPLYNDCEKLLFSSPNSTQFPSTLQSEKPAPYMAVSGGLHQSLRQFGIETHRPGSSGHGKALNLRPKERGKE